MRSKLLIIVALFIFAANAVSAQGQKIGFADVDYIFSQMPDSKQVEAALKAHQGQLESTYKAKVQDYQTKANAYQNLPATTSETVQRDKMMELAQLEQSIQQFEQSAQTELNNKRIQLMEPIYKKVGDAIEAVANEQGFDLILTASVGADVILFSKDEYDLSDAVLKKMGITPSGN